jgi:hypothetical protein
MSSELRDQLTVSLGPNYAIERELGGGGMSRVFLARDLTLDRAVVVKVLSSEYSAGVSADRFRREIQVIAKLQHPHVVPLLSAGSSEGGLYYVMPFLGGETLRARIAREGPLPIADCVRVLREVLDALAFAHSHGVIHRDIKPENILVEAGHAIVADFGVAKALKESGNMTSVGIALGTPTYMAPEQAAADSAADHRADLYAVGVVGYEMLTGSPPFSGSPQQVIRAHMVTEAVPVLQRRSDVPEPLAQLVMRALEKEPQDRPQSATEMLNLLASVTTPGTSATAATPPPAKRGANRAVLAAVAVVLLLGAFIAWRYTRPPVMASAQSLAIAPFSVATGDTALVRLGQNLVTTISANMDGVGEIRTADPMAVLSHARAKGALLSATDAMAIARRLGAKSVVHGTLVPTGSTVRADAVLYDVSGAGSQIARVSVIAPADSLAAMTDSLTWGLLRAVWGRGRPPTPAVSAITTHSPTALREFLEGERLFARGDITESSDAYKRAVAADSTFWYAHYRYRSARAWLALPQDTTITRRLRRHVMELPERERSLVATIDSALPQHQRVAAYRKLTERYPDYAPVWVTFGDFLIHHAGRSGHDIHDAIAPWQQAVRLMPGDMEAANHLAYACVTADDPCVASAAAHLDSLVRADSAPSIVGRLSQRMLLLLQAPGRKGLVDSLISVGRRDSIYPVGMNAWRMMFIPAAARQPELIAAWDRINRAAESVSDPLFGDVAGYFLLLDRAMRGDWSGIDSAALVRPHLRTPEPVFSRLAPMRMRALGELQGMITPDERTATGALGLATAKTADRNMLVEGTWIAGLNAMLRGDSTAYRRHLSTLAADTFPTSHIATRSLRAIAAGRGGSHAAAAESLLVLERTHGENAPKVWGAFAADRLLAAQWLSDEKRYEAADSLLRFTQAFAITGTSEAAQAIFAPAYLQRSRIAEGLGNTEAAVRFATVFLAAFDKAPASQKPLLDEARNRIARLGRQDVPKAQP